MSFDEEDLYGDIIYEENSDYDDIYSDNEDEYDDKGRLKYPKPPKLHLIDVYAMSRGFPLIDTVNTDPATKELNGNELYSLLRGWIFGKQGKYPIENRQYNDKITLYQFLDVTFKYMCYPLGKERYKDIRTIIKTMRILYKNPNLTNEEKCKLFINVSIVLLWVNRQYGTFKTYDLAQNMEYEANHADIGLYRMFPNRKGNMSNSMIDYLAELVESMDYYNNRPWYKKFLDFLKYDKISYY